MDDPSKRFEYEAIASYVGKCKEALKSEWEAEVMKAKIPCTCTIHVFAYKKRVLLAITPDDANTDVENLGVNYTMLDSKIFLEANTTTRSLVEDDETFQVYVSMISRSHGDWPKAPMYAAVVVSSTCPEMYRLVLDKVERGIRFQCRDMDIMGQRHNLVLGNFNSRTVMAKFPCRRPCRRPLDRLLKPIFLLGAYFLPADNTALDSPIVAPTSLNESQRQVHKAATQCRVSACIGPPATGKTRLLAEMILALHRAQSDDKIIVVAVTHVAVDELLRKVLMCCGTMQERQAVTRYYSTGRVDDDIIYEIIGPGKIPEGHIEGQRISAVKDTENYTKYQRNIYLNGLSLLRDEGGALENAVLSDVHLSESEDTNSEGEWGENEWDDWKTLRRDLTDRVLDRTKILFCTSSSIQGKGIYFAREDHGWPAKTCIFDEAGCAKPLDIMQPLLVLGKTLNRIVLCGDNRQLGPSLFSDIGKSTFGNPTWMTSLIKGKFPVTTLNVQYRSHNELYAPTSLVFYGDQVKSHHLTSEPRPFLQKIIAALPIVMDVGDVRYQIDSWRGFIDVSDGVAVTNNGGSSCNAQEAEAVSALVKAWLALPFITMGDIAVITGYRAQVKLLKELALRDDWSGVSVSTSPEESILAVKNTNSPVLAPLIRTIDSSQGAEYPIVILSLVRTHGDPGFMGELERANVSTSRAEEGIYFVGKYAFWAQQRAVDEVIGDAPDGTKSTNWMTKVIEAHRIAHERDGKKTFRRVGHAKGTGHQKKREEEMTKLQDGNLVEQGKDGVDGECRDDEELSEKNGPVEPEELVSKIDRLSI